MNPGARIVSIFTLSLAMLAGAGWMTPAKAQFAPVPASSATSDSLGIVQKIGDKIPVDATFTDDKGSTVTLGSYLGKRPLLIVPVEIGYDGSAALINDSLIRVLSKAGRQDKMRLARDWDVIILSINPAEKYELALAQKRNLGETIDAPTYFNPMRGTEPKRPPSQPKLDEGLHILTGSREDIKAVTDSVGFKFKYDPKEGVLANPLGTVFVSKDGLITGYTIGSEIVTKFAESNLKDATQGRLSEPADDGQKFAVYKVSKQALRNRPIIEGVISITGWTTLVALICSIAYMSFKYRTPPVPTRGADNHKPGGPQASA